MKKILIKLAKNKFVWVYCFLMGLILIYRVVDNIIASYNLSKYGSIKEVKIPNSCRDTSKTLFFSDKELIFTGNKNGYDCIYNIETNKFKKIETLPKEEYIPLFVLNNEVIYYEGGTLFSTKTSKKSNLPVILQNSHKKDEKLIEEKKDSKVALRTKIEGGKMIKQELCNIDEMKCWLLNEKETDNVDKKDESKPKLQLEYMKDIDKYYAISKEKETPSVWLYKSSIPSLLKYKSLWNTTHYTVLVYKKHKNGHWELEKTMYLKDNFDYFGVMDYYARKNKILLYDGFNPAFPAVQWFIPDIKNKNIYMFDIATEKMEKIGRLHFDSLLQCEFESGALVLKGEKSLLVFRGNK